MVAAEKRGAKAASPVEMSSGDGAAAVLVGEGKPVATLLAKASRTADFVDHFRSVDNQFDYQWEERWIRDAGYMPIVPPAIKRCLEQAKVAAKDVTHFCMPATLARVANSVAKAAGIDDKAVCDPLHANCGDTGAAHALMLLVAALEKAKAGEKILLVGFGQGADALLFEVTPEIAKLPKRLGVAGHLARRKEETSYGRFLAFNDLIELERGMRSETDKATPLSSLWRNRETVTSFTGGKCSKCGTLQFPQDRHLRQSELQRASTRRSPTPSPTWPARIKSYTADRLTYSPDPPSCYGMIEFEEGGRVMIDFTDIDADALKVGQPMQMMFRIKDIDTAPRLPPLLSGKPRRLRPSAEESLATMAKGIKDKVAILGMGCSKFGERWDKEADNLMVEAYTEAIADAGIDTKQIDAAWLATAIEEQHVGKSATPLAVALRLPFIPVTRVENYCASGTEAFRGAVYAVASGAADIALALGVEKLKDTGYGGLPQRGRGPLNDMTGPTARRPAASPSSPPPTAPSTASRPRTSSRPWRTSRSRATTTAPRTPRRTCATRSRSTPC